MAVIIRKVKLINIVKTFNFRSNAADFEWKNFPSEMHQQCHFDILQPSVSRTTIEKSSWQKRPLLPVKAFCDDANVMLKRYSFHIKAGADSLTRINRHYRCV